MPDPIIKVENLFYKYATREQFALEDVNINIQKGEFVAIIGQNGSGKTTLIKHFNGLHKPTQGKVIVDGRNSCLLRRGILIALLNIKPISKLRI
ncbi:MAG: ABC transporter [Chloroflexi bacterium]|nr:MAG: ABC transporter [Chloroflexota bacterium]MBA4375648.1 hypothetical protein [Anaerolinea sp.]